MIKSLFKISLNIQFDNLQPILLLLLVDQKGNLSHSAKNEIGKMINPIGWHHIFHPQKPYIDCAYKVQDAEQQTFILEKHHYSTNAHAMQ